MRANELSSTAQTLKTRADDLSRTAHAGKICAAHLAQTAHPVTKWANSRLSLTAHPGPTSADDLSCIAQIFKMKYMQMSYRLKLKANKYVQKSCHLSLCIRSKHVEMSYRQ